MINQECKVAHFKMESIKQVIQMIKPNTYLALLYIKDAFCTAPIYETHTKHLKFIRVNKAYQFNVMLIGYVDALRLLKKILNPPFC